MGKDVMTWDEPFHDEIARRKKRMVTTCTRLSRLVGQHAGTATTTATVPDKGWGPRAIRAWGCTALALTCWWYLGTVSGPVAAATGALVTLAIALARAWHESAGRWLRKHCVQVEAPPAGKPVAYLGRVELMSSVDIGCAIRDTNARGATGTAPYWFSFKLRPVPPRAFFKNARLSHAYASRLAGKTPQQVDNELLHRGGTWTAEFRAGTPDPNAAGEVLARFKAQWPSVALETSRLLARKAYYFGSELVPVVTVPREIVPSVNADLPAEFHTPVRMYNDVAIGRALEPESLQAGHVAGITFANAREGVFVMGGLPAERLAVLSAIATGLAAAGARVLAIDVDGTFSRLPGARVHSTRGTEPLAISPFVPPYCVNGANIQHMQSWVHEHLQHVTRVLSMAFSWTETVEAAFAMALEQPVMDKAGSNTVPGPGDVFAGRPVGDGAAGFSSDAAWHAASRVFTLENQHLWAQFDSPALGQQFLDGHHGITAFDVSAVQGVAQRVLAGILLLKLGECVLNARANGWRGTVAIVSPATGDLFHDARTRIQDTKFVQDVKYFWSAIAGSGAWLVHGVSLPSRVPASMLQAAGALLSFRVPDPDDATHVASVMGLQDEDISGRKRHASYQERYLRLMDRVGSDPGHVAVAWRRDVPKAFLVLVDVEGRVPRDAGAPAAFQQGQAGSRRGAESPFLHRLRSLGPAWPSVLAILDSLGSLGGIGTKKDDILKYIAAELARDGMARNPGVPGSTMVADARQRAARFMDAMINARHVIVTLANNTGLADDVMVKLSGAARVHVRDALADAGVKARQGGGGGVA